MNDQKIAIFLLTAILTNATQGEVLALDAESMKERLSSIEGVGALGPKRAERIMGIMARQFIAIIGQLDHKAGQETTLNRQFRDLAESD